MGNAIQEYDHLLGQLKHPQENKIHRLIETARLEMINKDYWICKPTAGYNTTTYNLFRTPYGDFNCSCQGYHKRGSCSHSVALRITLQAQGENFKQGSFF